MSLPDFFRVKYFVFIILLCGIAIRVGTYLFNRSMVLDEAATILQVIEQGPYGLITNRSPEQGAPIGFLLMLWEIIIVFGKNEYVLRLVPVISSIISLFLFVAIAKKLFSGSTVLLGLALFSFSRPLIDYSSVVKQHSGDVLISGVLILLMVTLLWNKQFSLRSALIVAIVGSLVIWFSQPVLFILGGVGITIFLHTLLSRRDTRRTLILVVVGLLWFTNFILIYHFYYSHTYGNDDLVTAMNGLYLLPELSLRGVQMLFQMFLWIPEFTLGMWPVWVGFALFVVGSIVLFVKNRWTFLLLFTPIFLAMAASHYRLYPFFERYLLFLTPNIFLIIAYGMVHLSHLVPERFVTYRRIVIVGISIVILAPMVWGTVHRFGVPWWSEELRPLLVYYQKNAQPNDTLYLYYGSLLAYRYYALTMDLPDSTVVKGVDRTNNLSRYVRDLQQLDGKKRVWVAFSHIKVGPNVNEELFFLSYLDTIGKRMDTKSAPGADLFLYDL